MDINYKDLLDRMKTVGKLKNDSAVARTVGVTPQALSNYKKRGKMPMNLVLKFATAYELSLDWLITGEGQIYKDGRKVDDFEAPKAELKKLMAYATLNPDEIINVGKLLKIMRGSERASIEAIEIILNVGG